jgi:hypothetical protein
MISRAKQFLQKHQAEFSQTPFGCLVRLFTARMFHGGGEPGSQELDLGIGVILTVLAMPGALVSLLMFEKYGSLIRFLRGERVFDPYKAATPDEYFFIVLSMVITGAAALWLWDGIFPDRRDYMNLVPLPISTRTIFSANFSAILVLAGLFTLVVNVASLFLFPMAVVGSQDSFWVFFRFAAGHAVTVFLASAFSFFAVFAAAGLLMALLPPTVFRRISLFARFLIAICFLALLASSFTVPHLLTQLSVTNAHRIALLPPVSFLGLARTLWGQGGEPFVALMTKASLSAVALAIFGAMVANTLSFRRSFLRLPELADVAPLPRLPFSLSPMAPLHNAILPKPSQRACYQFVARTLLRSEAHLQVLLGVMAIGLVVAAESLNSVPDLHSALREVSPPTEILAIPYILGYSIIVGIRFAFEIPAQLAANWVFRYSLDADNDDVRPIARRVLLMFCLPCLAPASFVLTLIFWGWTRALLHVSVLIACSMVLVELLLIRFRKLPFTCSPPRFQSYSGLVLVAYLFGFILFTDYLPRLEHWALYSPIQVVWFAPLLGTALLGVYQYRKQMLDMDKQLIFEESSASGF